MSALFEELASSDTPAGVFSLRRRHDPSSRKDVYEVKLGDEFLMSSLFTVAEIELARLGLAAHDGDDLDVVVGGLGLGYTAVAALEDDRVASLSVVEAVPELIAWHEQGLVPEAATMSADARTRFVLGDFFAMSAGEGFDPEEPGRRFDAILLDVDHSPRNLLHERHGAFYTPAGLHELSRFLADDGVFGLWSDDAPDDDFLAAAREVFTTVESHVVAFRNPYTGGESTNTVYVARDVMA